MKKWTGVIIRNHDTVITSVLTQTTHYNHQNIVLLKNMMSMIIFAHAIINMIMN